MESDVFVVFFGVSKRARVVWNFGWRPRASQFVEAPWVSGQDCRLNARRRGSQIMHILLSVLYRELGSYTTSTTSSSSYYFLRATYLCSAFPAVVRAASCQHIYFAFLYFLKRIFNI